MVTVKGGMARNHIRSQMVRCRGGSADSELPSTTKVTDGLGIRTGHLSFAGEEGLINAYCIWALSVNDFY